MQFQPNQHRCPAPAFAKASAGLAEARVHTGAAADRTEERTNYGS